MPIKNLSVVLPVYNEEKNIAAVLGAATSILPAVAGDFEVIIVDDGSTDGTKGILAFWQKADARIKVICHSRNRGYGAAIRSGFKAAAKEWVFLMDADGQFDISDIKKLAPYCDDHDVIAGFRAKRMDAWYRLFLSRCFNFAMRMLFGLCLKDLNCGFKLFKKELLDKIGLCSEGWLITAEVMSKIIKNKARIKEVAVSHYPRRFGVPHGSDIRLMIKALREIRFLWS